VRRGILKWTHLNLSLLDTYSTPQRLPTFSHILLLRCHPFAYSPFSIIAAYQGCLPYLTYLDAGHRTHHHCPALLDFSETSLDLRLDLVARRLSPAVVTVSAARLLPAFCRFLKRLK
jgi:hypothetical protein